MFNIIKLKIESAEFKIWFLWAVSLLINIISFFILYFKIHPTSKTLTLHYNVLVGVEWYGKGLNLYLIPLAGLIFTVANFLLFWALKGSNKFFAPLTVLISLCCSLALMASVLLLLTVN